jgi:hypothetical protein
VVDGKFLPETMSGRIVIDPKTFNEEAQAKKEEVSSDDDKDDEKDKEEKKPCNSPKPFLTATH